MKKRTSLVVLVLALILMLAGCSSVRQKILGSNDMNLTYVGIASDGSHRYTSDVGELTWLEGKIDLDGKRFGVVSGRSGDFTFEDGRTLTAAVDASGTLVSVSVQPDTEVKAEDYPVIRAALLVYQAESSIIASRNTATVVSVIILLVLSAAAIFAVGPVMAFLKLRGWLNIGDDRKILLYCRIGGIALAIIAVIVIIGAVF